MSRLLRKIALAPRGVFFLLPFYVQAAACGGLSGPVLYFPSPIFLIAALWIRRSLRRPLQRREFELDRTVAEQFGIPEVLQVLETNGKSRSDTNTNRLQIFLSSICSIGKPSVRERTGHLSGPPPVDLPRSSRIPRIVLRGLVIVTLPGFAIFWGSGFVAGNLYARGRTTVVCMDTTCSALVVICRRRILSFYYRGHKQRNMDTPTISLN